MSPNQRQKGYTKRPKPQNHIQIYISAHTPPLLCNALFKISQFQFFKSIANARLVSPVVPFRIGRSKIRDFLATRPPCRCTGSQKRHVLGHFHSADRPGRLHLRYVLDVARRKIPRFSIDTRLNTNRFRKFESHRDREGRFG